MIKNHPNCADCFHLKTKPFVQTSTGGVYLNLNRDTKTWCELDNWRKLRAQYPDEVNTRYSQITLRSLRERSSMYEIVASVCKDYDEDDI